MTYNQWIKQKTKPDKDEKKEDEKRHLFRYPIGKVIHVDNRYQFEQFATVRA